MSVPISMLLNRRRRLLPAFLLELCIALAAPVCFAENGINTDQAQAMLNLLEQCHEKKAPAKLIDEVMDLPGTGLIIAQQNIFIYALLLPRQQRV